MIIDHRTYTIPHGRMEEYLERYEKFGLPVQLRHLGHLIGCFVSEIGPLNQVIHIWAYEDLADRERRRAAMNEDPEWAEFRKINSGSFVAQETRILRATSFSPRHLAAASDEGEVTKDAVHGRTGPVKSHEDSAQV